MKLQLHSIEQAPSSVPIWQLLMDDLCQPPPARVARVLGLGVRTVQRYNATGYAPRHVCLAVFWLTSWGRQSVHAQAHNDAVLMVGYVNGLRSQVDALEGHVSHLMSIGDFGCANQPADDQPSRRTARDLIR